jgi:hypothetical protein
VVALLNPGWRVIACRDGVQWILQHRARPEVTDRLDVWAGRSFCRTKEALLRVCREHAGTIDPAAQVILSALPDRIELSA